MDELVLLNVVGVEVVKVFECIESFAELLVYVATAALCVSTNACCVCSEKVLSLQLL